MAEIAGLKLITPSSVDGTGVSLSGAKVLFTAATSVSVNGVFDSTYDNYLIVLSADVSSGRPNMRFRLSGTDASGTDYVFQQILADNTSVSGIRNTFSFFNVAPEGSTPGGAHIYIYAPALAQITSYRSVSANTVSGAVIRDHAGTHNVATAYDGVTLYRTSGNMTGSLTVYGLSQ